MKVTSQHFTNTHNRADDHDSLNFKSALLKYLKNWPVFIVSISMAMLIAFVVNQFTPPVYKINGKVLIKEESNPINLFDFSAAGTNGILPKGQKLANEAIMLKSRAIAEHALDNLPFDVEYYEEGLFINSEIYRNIPVDVSVDWNHPQLTNGRILISWTNGQSYQLQLIDREYQQIIPGEEKNVIIGRPVLSQTNYPFREWISFPQGKFMVDLKSASDSGSLVIKIRDRESLLQQYTGDHLTVSPVDKTSSILLLTLDTQQPQKGRDYLDMLMSVYLENELDEKNAIARNTLNFIDSQLTGISDSLSHTETKLEKFRSRNRTYNISTEGNTMFEKLSELERSLAHEKFKRKYYLNLQEYLVREHYSEIVVPSGLGIEDPVLNTLIEDLMRNQSDKSRFLATQTENSPTVIEVNRKIKDLNKAIKEVLKNVNHNTDLLISDMQKRIAKMENQFGKLPATEQDLLNIKRRYSLNENIYTFLLQRRAEAAISLASNMPSNKIIEPAVLTFVPMQLRPLLNYFMAMLFGFLIPIALISLKEFFSVKIKDIKEVEQKLIVPVVGFIHKNKMTAPLVVFNRPRSGITESFRALRTNIDFIFHRDKQVTILITSTIAGEGKSFCAMNLASVYAVAGKKTIIVECDMHKQFAFDGIKTSDVTGLSNFLSGQINQVKDIIQPTDYAGLDILAPGPVPPNPAELLINDRFTQMIEELKNMYDVILLDSSPLGLTNETLYLTRISDLTLFVVRQDYSKKTFLEDINSLKKKKGIKKIYAVINDIGIKYLNYQGYGYGYYDEDAREKNPVKKFFRTILSRAAV